MKDKWFFCNKCGTEVEGLGDNVEMSFSVFNYPYKVNFTLCEKCRRNILKYFDIKLNRPDPEKCADLLDYILSKANEKGGD